MCVWVCGCVGVWVGYNYSTVNKTAVLIIGGRYCVCVWGGGGGGGGGLWYLSMRGVISSNEYILHPFIFLQLVLVEGLYLG